MKPFYRKNLTAIVFKSVHEESEYLVIVKEDDRKQTFFRVDAKGAENAAEVAFDRMEKLPDRLKIHQEFMRLPD